jgi:hypothetical protein
VYYKNLHLMTHCFVGGTVVRYIAGVEECAAGATVILSRDGQEIARTTTDTFGEFKLDRLPPDSGRYVVDVVGEGGRATMSFGVGADSLYLGVLMLS